MDATRTAVLEAALDTPFNSDGCGDTTPREYLTDLLQKILSEGECFSGKRPWGNSGWESELALPLIQSGALKGTIDLYGPQYPECLYKPQDYSKVLNELVEVLCQKH